MIYCVTGTNVRLIRFLHAITIGEEYFLAEYDADAQRVYVIVLGMAGQQCVNLDQSPSDVRVSDGKGKLGEEGGKWRLALVDFFRFEQVVKLVLVEFLRFGLEVNRDRKGIILLNNDFSKVM